jgi:hypothetical protein
LNREKPTSTEEAEESEGTEQQMKESLKREYARR